MAILAEYALTPDVFDATCYSSDEVCGLHLQTPKDVLLHEGLVRNLRDGAWALLFADLHRPWHRRAKELLKKLATQRRLIPRAPVLPSSPATDAQRCDEAIATHRALPVAGIIVTDGVAAAYSTESIVAPVHKLNTTPWWIARSSSLRLSRTLANYLAALDLVLRHANSIMFIDPHVDPSRPDYKDFIALLQAAGDRTPAPWIEVHRVCYRGSGRARQLLDLDALEASFRHELTVPLRAAGVSVEVFVWDDFHDRHLISDLVGIVMGNGFDTTSRSGLETTWARLGRDNRDDIQRDFHPASGHHGLKRRFSVP